VRANDTFRPKNIIRLSAKILKAIRAEDFGGKYDE
jgi:hypothetical protein